MLASSPTRYASIIQRLSEVGNERRGFFETEKFHAVVEHLPEYLRDFGRCNFLIGWRKGGVQSLRRTDVTGDVFILRAVKSKTHKAESIPLEGELHDIIERRRSLAVWQDRNGQGHFSEYVFHRDGQPIGNFRKSWATACCAAGIGKRVVRAANRTWTREQMLEMRSNMEA